jgi:hypothetical protein
MPSANAKLTLSLDKKIIASAKKYAQKRGKSVSKIVQDYLASISKSETEQSKPTIGPLTRELSGILKGKSVDYKRDIAEYLEKKYK